MPAHSYIHIYICLYHDRCVYADTYIHRYIHTYTYTLHTHVIHRDLQWQAYYICAFICILYMRYLELLGARGNFRSSFRIFTPQPEKQRNNVSFERVLPPPARPKIRCVRKGHGMSLQVQDAELPLHYIPERHSPLKFVVPSPLLRSMFQFLLDVPGQLIPAARFDGRTRLPVLWPPAKPVALWNKT